MRCVGVKVNVGKSRLIVLNGEGLEFEVCVNGTDKAECRMKLARRIARAYVLMYSIETMIWKEKERSRIRWMQMNNIRDLLGIRREDKVSNEQIRKLSGVTKGAEEMKELIKVFSDGLAMGRKKNDRIVKRVYIGECAGSRRQVD